MVKTKYLILGAGPSGLSFANRLLNNKEDDFVILEKNKEAGGLCRSTTVDGYPLDIGGGHFLDVKRKDVLDFLFTFMPEQEWNLFERNTKIDVKGTIINYPIESNIWQFPIDKQAEYLESIANAGCNVGKPMPDKFVDWIYWKLGNKIADDYMIPYNQKMFGNNLNELGTYWLDKLPNVSYEESLISCLKKQPYGYQPAHTKFYYPKQYGYGEVFSRMAETLKDKIIYNYNVSKLNYEKLQVNNEYEAEYIINTIPWTEMEIIGSKKEMIHKLIERLRYTSIVVSYKADNIADDGQWMYCPDLELDYHRIINRHNFCDGANGYWTETNLDRYKNNDDYSYVNEYAYPLNTIGKQEDIATLLDIMQEHNVIGLGRWGEWQHYNSDVVIERAINLADKFKKT